MSHPVKFIHSGQAGTPVLSGSAGALIPVLDAFLVDGACLKAIDSITVAAGVATVSISGGHPYEDTNIVLIAGSGQAGLNGEHWVEERTTAAFKFDATGVPDGTYGGSVTAKLAPLGWERVFSGANKAVYRPTDPAASRFYLRVDDSAPQYARVRCYEHMTDVDTGYGPVPTDADLAGGYFWGKSDSASASARRWYMAGDGQFLYYGWAPYSAFPSTFATAYFGNPLSRRSNDPFGVLTSGAPSVYEATSNGGSAYWDAGFSYNAANTGAMFSRALSGLGGARPSARAGLGGGHGYFSGRGDYSAVPLVFPNPADNAMLLTVANVWSDSGLRARLPGLRHALHAAVDAYPAGDFAPLDGFDEWAGRKMRPVRCGPPAGGYAGVMFLDVSGPWR